MLRAGQAAVTPYALLVFACLVIAGCSDSQRFEFAGARDDFCVPNEYLIDGPIWLTRDMAADNGGFAWRGCGTDYRGRCDIPGDVEGGTVGPRSTLRSHAWGDFRPHTNPWEVTRRALDDRSYRLIADGSGRSSRILATPTGSSPTGVFYWRIPAAGEPDLVATTPLLAECDGVNAKQSSDGAEVAFHCVRVVDVGDYALRYRFTSGSVSSAFIDELDHRIIAGINKWRCPKR